MSGRTIRCSLQRQRRVDREPVVGHGQEGTGRRIADGRLNRFDPYWERGQKHELVDRYLDTELTAGPLQPGAQAGDPPDRQVGLEFRDPARIQGRPNRPFASEGSGLDRRLGRLDRGIGGTYSQGPGAELAPRPADRQLALHPGLFEGGLGQLEVGLRDLAGRLRLAWVQHDPRPLGNLRGHIGLGGLQSGLRLGLCRIYAQRLVLCRSGSECAPLGAAGRQRAASTSKPAAERAAVAASLVLRASSHVCSIERTAAVWARVGPNGSQPRYSYQRATAALVRRS